MIFVPKGRRYLGEGLCATLEMDAESKEYGLEILRVARYRILRSDAGEWWGNIYEAIFRSHGLFFREAVEEEDEVPPRRYFQTPRSPRDSIHGVHVEVACPDGIWPDVGRSIQALDPDGRRVIRNRIQFSFPIAKALFRDGV